MSKRVIFSGNSGYSADHHRQTEAVRQNWEMDLNANFYWIGRLKGKYTITPALFFLSVSVALHKGN